MRKTFTILALGMISSGAWAGSGNPLFDNTDNHAGVLNQIDSLAPGMAMKERGEGDFYGTSLRAWGGGASVGRAQPEDGSTDIYGSVLFDVDPKLPY